MGKLDGAVVGKRLSLVAPPRVEPALQEADVWAMEDFVEVFGRATTVLPAFGYPPRSVGSATDRNP